MFSIPGARGSEHEKKSLRHLTRAAGFYYFSVQHPGLQNAVFMIAYHCLRAIVSRIRIRPRRISSARTAIEIKDALFIVMLPIGSTTC